MTPPWSIRSLGREDLGLLPRIDPRLEADAPLRGRLANLVGDGLSWVAEAEGAPLGFAIVTRHFFNYPFVDLIHVHAARRREGVARALMEHCEAAHASDRIFTSTNESNDPMRTLLARIGWRACGHVDALDEGDPELFFVKFRAPEQ
jgi:GNAT superfamily N-acetyltransferase